MIQNFLIVTLELSNVMNQSQESAGNGRIVVEGIFFRELLMFFFLDICRTCRRRNQQTDKMR